MNSIFELLKEEKISQADSVALFVVNHVLKQNPNFFYQGYRKAAPSTFEDQSTPEVELTWKMMAPPRFSEIRFWDFIYSSRLKLISEKVTQALLGWKFQNWDLVLYDRILHPEEVLTLQTLGKRCVSVFWDKDPLTAITETKNSFEFTIHDLEHAERFFNSSECYKGQVEFYKRLKQNWIQNKWKFLYESDSEFKKDFNYLMSDMNTHPEHQSQYLKAIVTKSLKRTKGNVCDSDLVPYLNN